MAAYAALLSLSQTLEQILYSSAAPSSWILPHAEAHESLLAKARFLLDFLHDSTQISFTPEMGSLESRITSVAYSAEDLVESHHALAESSIDIDEQFTRNLHELIERMGAIGTEAVQTVGQRDPQEPLISSPAASSRSAPSDRVSMIGFDEKLIQIMERFTEQQSDREVVTITGMGGIGKTTLAKNVYDNPCIVQHFDLRAWVVISQDYSAPRIILHLLRDIIHINEDAAAEDLEKLGEKLYKKLYGRRYLIVMDDLWSVEAWDAIRKFFPDDTRGSKILITTRLSNVALHCDSSSPFVLEFLSKDQSWSLFCDKVFGQEACPCPLELEEVGMKIADSCRGLPLALVTVGGLLAKLNRTRRHWENVAENISTAINSGNDEHCLKLLTLSYHHLPICLKPCFLYLAIFPEDKEISVSRLIKLWIAEGFVKPDRNRSCEDVAMEYLTDLMDRNLILVRRRGSMGKVKKCAVHDLVRDLCLREASKQNFLWCTSVDTLSDLLQDMKGKPCHRFLGSLWERQDILQLSHVLGRKTFLRSLVCHSVRIPNLLVVNLRLLKVLDVSRKFSSKHVGKLLNLRYVYLRSEWSLDSNLFSSIHLLRNLQTIVVHRSSMEKPIILPSEIWEMIQLRHIEFSKVILPDPPSAGNGGPNSLVLANLLTLLVVENLKFTEPVFKRLPCLKKLKISYRDLPKGEATPLFRLKNIIHLDKLENLRCRVFHKMDSAELAFPSSLKKLTLCGSRLPWRDMKIVGLLPNLEVLKLEYYAVQGLEWHSSEGEFMQLKFLQINKTNLLHWEAESSHFPRLEHLVLHDLDLKEIPEGLGEIDTLRLIRLHHCLNSAIISVKQIMMERESMGNQDLHVRISIPWRSDNILSLATDQFQVHVSPK